jgi:hypothetical protein
MGIAKIWPRLDYNDYHGVGQEIWLEMDIAAFTTLDYWKSSRARDWNRADLVTAGLRYG